MVLVEVQAVAVELGGNVLGEIVLDHLKYPQLLLAENVRGKLGDTVDVSVVDLKSSADAEWTEYSTIDYCGKQISCHFVGKSLEAADDVVTKAQLVGVSANFTFERSSVVRFIRHARAVNAGCLIVVGGHDATAQPGYYLARGADLCVLGEGEGVLVELIEAYRQGQNVQISGTAWLDGGQVRRSSKRRIRDLSDVTFPSTAALRNSIATQCPDGPFPRGVTGPVAVMETSRGCGERCSFCDSSFIVGPHRSFAGQQLTSYARELGRSEISSVLFADDNLLHRMLPRNRGTEGRQEILDLMGVLRDSGLAWTFYNGLQIGLLMSQAGLDDELIRALYGHSEHDSRLVGCFRAYLPLEKFTPLEMKALPKLRSIDEELSIVEAIAAQEVPELNVGFIIGGASESRDALAVTERYASQFRDTIRRASDGRTLPRVLPWCSVPIPGTPDFTHFAPAIKYSAEDFPELYSNYTSVVSPPKLSPLDLTLFRQELEDNLNDRSLKLHRIQRPATSESRAQDE